MSSDVLTLLMIGGYSDERRRYRCNLQSEFDLPLNCLDVSSASEGLSMLRCTVPDVILLNNMLPDMTVIELMQQIQSHQPTSLTSTKQPAVLVLTNGSDETTTFTGMGQGIQGCLRKDTLTPKILARAVTQAIAQVQFQYQLHRSQALQHIVARCALKIYQAHQLDELFETVVNNVHQFLQCDRAVIYQFHPDMSGTVIAESVHAEWTKTIGMRIEDTFFRRCGESAYKEMQLRVVNDVSTANLDTCHSRMLAKFQIQAFAFVPILLQATADIAETNLWGLLVVHQCAAPRQWDKLELILLSDIAVQMAIAIQQFGLVQQLQKELAERKQAEQNLVQAHRILKQMNKELETRVAERTSTLNQLNVQLQKEVIHRQEIQHLFHQRDAEFEAIFQAIPDAAIFTNTQHHIQSVNHAFMHLFGYAADSLLPQKLQELYQYPDDDASKELSDGCEWSNAHRHEHIYRCCEGTFLIGETFETGVYDNSGSLIGYLSLIRDISDRKQAEVSRHQAELALRDSERRFRAIFNQTFQIVGLLAPGGTVLNINQTALDFANISRESVLHQFFWETIWWQQSPTAQRQLRYSIAQAKTGQFVRYEVEIQGAGDRKEIIDFSLKPVSDGQDNVRWILAEGRIITQRIVLERELRSQKQLLNSFFNAASVAQIGACIFDEERRYVHINSALADINGCSVQAHLGKHIEEIVTEVSSASSFALDHVFENWQSVQNVQITGNYLPQLGVPRCWLASYFPITNDDPKKQAVGMITVEITHQKQIEQELMQLNQALHSSNEELEQFAYVASHDLREPLRKIRSYSELFAKRYAEHLDDRADRYIGYIVNGVSRMNTLINDLLTYSRLGRGDVTYNLVDLNQLIHHVIDGLSPVIQESQAHIEIVNPLPVMTVNSSQIHQLFQNLIENAIKYRSDAQPHIEVTASADESGWQFSVTDNGIGIAPEFAERIFVIFQRLHTRDAYPGTGIGLAICKRVVEHHGGSIWLESSESQGTTICFTLRNTG
ncbi:MAG: PAS domain S-box protein [Cyanobacteria bacterium P01_A01_bin.37]